MRRFGVDSIQSWILAVAGTLVLLTTSGSFLGSSVVLYKYYIDVHLVTEEAASWPSSIHSGFAVVAGPVVTILCTRWSVKSVSALGVLFYSIGSCACYFSTSLVFVSIFYGAMSGLGNYTTYILIPALMTTAFDKYRVTAMSLVMMALPLGTLIFPWITNALLERYGISGTFLILGAVSMHGLIGSILLVHHEEKVGGDTISTKNRQNLHDFTSLPTRINANSFNGTRSVNTISFRVENSGLTTIHYSENSSQVGELPIGNGVSPGEDNNQKLNSTLFKTSRLLGRLSKLLKNRGFHISNLAQCMSYLMSFLYVLIMVDYATKKGVPYSKSLSLTLSYSIGLITSRVLLMCVSKNKLISRTLFMFISYGIVAGLCFIIPFIFQYEWLMFITVLYSILFGNLIPIGNVLFADYLSKEDIVLAMSVSRSTVGILSILRSIIIGIFRGGNGIYDNLFIFMGASSVLTSFAMLAEYVWKRRINMKDNQ